MYLLALLVSSGAPTRAAPEEIKKTFKNNTDGGRVFASPTVLNFEKSKFTRKNQQFFTNGHFPAPYDPIGKTVTLTFQARSVRTHFRGVVMGSNADFNKNG